MRLDKYLKVSRLIKRRPLAKDICEAGGVEVNGRPAKPSTPVKPGDVLTLRLGKRLIRVEVLATPDNPKASQAKEIYRLLSSVQPSQEDE